MIPTGLHAMVGSVGFSMGLLSNFTWLKSRIEDYLTMPGDGMKDRMYTHGLPGLIALVATGIVSFFVLLGYLMFFQFSDAAEIFADALYRTAIFTAGLVPG